MQIKNLVLGIGIVVVFALVLWQGVETFYPSPDWNDFCGTEFAVPKIAVPTANCTFSEELRLKQQQCYSQNGQPIMTYDSQGCEVDVRECNFCNLHYEEAAKKHSQNVFFISLIVAILAVIIGFTILKVEPVGSALIASGIWAIFWGTVVNWRNFATWGRFLILLAALILLIWLSLRLNKKKRLR